MSLCAIAEYQILSHKAAAAAAAAKIRLTSTVIIVIVRTVAIMVIIVMIDLVAPPRQICRPRPLRPILPPRDLVSVCQSSSGSQSEPRRRRRRMEEARPLIALWYLG
jgi:hypothetical protein